MSKIKVYTRFDRPNDPGVKCTQKEGRTLQEFKEECDINNIIDRYANTGLWSSSLRPPVETPMFGDFTAVPDFQKAMDIIAKSKEHFDSLPSSVRERFGNDPAKLLAYVSDENNYSEAVKLGIANPRPEVAPVATDPPKGVPA